MILFYVLIEETRKSATLASVLQLENFTYKVYRATFADSRITGTGSDFENESCEGVTSKFRNLPVTARRVVIRRQSIGSQKR